MEQNKEAKGLQSDVLGASEVIREGLPEITLTTLGWREGASHGDMQGRVDILLCAAIWSRVWHAAAHGPSGTCHLSHSSKLQRAHFFGVACGCSPAKTAERRQMAHEIENAHYLGLYRKQLPIPDLEQ